MLYNKAQELGLIVHAAGNVEDHVHVVASIPPKLAVAECVRQIKGASAYAINRILGGEGNFKWQGGYGALTIDELSLPIVMAYANNKKEHHRTNQFIAVYERMDGDEDETPEEK